MNDSDIHELLNKMEEFAGSLEDNLANVFTESKIQTKLSAWAMKENLGNQQGLVSMQKREYEETFIEWSDDMINYKNLLERLQKMQPGNERIRPLISRFDNCLQTLNNRRRTVSEWS